MSKKGKILLGTILAVTLVVGLYFLNRYWISPAARGQATSSRAHPLAPTFSLRDISGQTLNLADYRGKVVLLDFWATWCGPCLIEIPGFVELQNRYRDQGFAAIGISMDDSAEPVREFYRQYKMNYPVAMGDTQLAELYGGIFGLPTTFLIGRDGRIYSKHVGATSLAVFEDEIRRLLAAEGAEEVTEFKPPGSARPGEKIELGDPAVINSEVPGVNLSRLSAVEIAQFKRELEAMPCACGCKMNALKCRHDDRSCSVSRRLAREQLERYLKRPV